MVWKNKIRKCKRKKNEPNQRNPPIAVLVVPSIPGGELATLLKEAEVDLTKITKDLIKIVERSGRIIENILH